MSGFGGPTDNPWTFGTPAQPVAPGTPGGSSARKGGRVGRRVGFALVTAAALAVGVVGVAAAVDPSPSPSSGTTTPAPGTSGQDRDGPHGFRHWGRGMMGPSIHGQFVVPKSGGGYQTMDQQRGKVTAVSPTSITVQSEDGFGKTYTVTSTTVVRSTRDRIADVKTDDQVGVLAVENNGKATALRIVDITQVGAERHRHGHHPQPTSGSTQPSGTF